MTRKIRTIPIVIAISILTLFSFDDKNHAVLLCNPPVQPTVVGDSWVIKATGSGNVAYCLTPGAGYIVHSSLCNDVNLPNGGLEWDIEVTNPSLLLIRGTITPTDCNGVPVPAYAKRFQIIPQ